MYPSTAANKADLMSAKEKLAKQFRKIFDSRLSTIYIEPQGAERENAQPEQTFPLLQEAADRLMHSSLHSLLILDDSSCLEKTCLSLLFCKTVWERIHVSTEEIPLPLYIYLPQYKEYLTQDLLEQVLLEAELSQKELYVLTKETLLLVLDGFDDVSISHNLYRSQGWGNRKFNIKMLVTCQPKTLVNQNAQDLFEPSELMGEGLAYFNTIYLQAFNKDQIEDYLKRYLSEQKKNENEFILPLQDYLDWLTRLPSLTGLAKTPFLLAVIAQALPQMLSTLPGDVITEKQLTQNELFRHFLDNWFLKQAQQVKEQGKMEGLSALDIAAYMRAYAQNLAGTRMSKDGYLDDDPVTEEECLRPDLVKPIHDKDFLSLYHAANPQKLQWQLFFTEDNQGNKIPVLENIQAISSGCLLHMGSKRFKFLHKSIIEYLAAYELIEGLLGNDGDYLHTLLGEDNQEQGLNRVLLTKEHQIIMYLAETVENTPPFKDLLNKILLASKEIPKLSIAAANAITILNYAGVVFNYQDLSDVQIPGADLSLGKFCNTHFEEANLAGVNFRQANLSGASFRGANLDAVEFGESAYWKLPSAVHCIAAYHPNPEVLQWLIGCEDGYVYNFEDKTEKQIGYFRHWSYFEDRGKAILALGVHNACHYLATGGANSKIRLWDLRSHKVLTNIIVGNYFDITALLLTPDGKTLISANEGGTVRLWTLPDGQPGPVLSTGAVTALAVSPSGKTLMSSESMLCGSADISDLTVVRVWDLPNGQSRPALSGHSDFVYALAVSPDGKTLMSGSGDYTIRLWTLPDGQPGPVLYGHRSVVTTLAVSPDGKTLVSGSLDKTIRLWSVPQGQPGLILSGHSNCIKALAVSPNGKTLMSGSQDKTVRRWALPDVQPMPLLREHEGVVTTLAVSPDGKTLVSGSWDRTIRLWSLPGGCPGPVLRGHTSTVTTLAVSPDGKTLVSGSEDGTVRWWTLPEGQPGSVLHTHMDSVYALAVCPDGKTLMVGSGKGTVQQWTLPGYQPGTVSQTEPVLISDRYTSYVTTLALNLDGKTLVENGGYTKQELASPGSPLIQLWTLPDSLPMPVLYLHYSLGVCYRYSKYRSPIPDLTALAVNPDGKTLIVGSRYGVVQLWSLPDCQPQRVLRKYVGPYKGYVSVLKTSLDGKLLIAGIASMKNEFGGTIQLWSLPEGKYLSKIKIGLVVTSLLVQENQLIIGGMNGEILSIQFGSLFSAKCNPIINWLSGLTKLCLNKTELQQTLNLSRANQALCKQRGAIGKPNPVLNMPYKAWCSLFQPIPDSTPSQTQLSLIGIQNINQVSHHPLTDNSWVLSIARKNGNSSSSGASLSGFFSYFRRISGTDSTNRVFLILEGIKEHRHFIVRAELMVDEDTSMHITLNRLDDLVEFKQSTQGYEANQFEITAEQGKKLLQNIRQDQQRKINSTIRGENAKPASTSSSSTAQNNSNIIETHNCLSWCHKHIELIGCDMPLRWYNFWVTLPTDVTRMSHAQTSNEASSSLSSFPKCEQADNGHSSQLGINP